MEVLISVCKMGFKIKMGVEIKLLKSLLNLHRANDLHPTLTCVLLYILLYQMRGLQCFHAFIIFLIFIPSHLRMSYLCSVHSLHLNLIAIRLILFLSDLPYVEANSGTKFSLMGSSDLFYNHN